MSDDRVRLVLGSAAHLTLSRLLASGPFRYVAERDLLAMAVGYGLDHLERLATLQENAPMSDNDRGTLSNPYPGLTEGRVVHYVLRDGRNAGQHRPAIVVKVWRTPATETDPLGAATGTVQLAVFLDGSNDDSRVMAAPMSAYMSALWATSVMHDEDEKKPGSWHWIERA